MRDRSLRPEPWALSLAFCALWLVSSAHAQAPAGRQGGAGAAAGPPPTARSAAPVDLTGQWVSVVTEDWRWRMVTPPKGDFASVPLNAEGRKVAEAWDLAADNAAGNQCRAFGAGAIMRVPARIRISWQDDATLKLETDAGQQTRLFRFANPTPGGVMPTLPAMSGERTWQGQSTAQWFRQPQSRGLGFGRGGALTGGSLRVVTRHMRSGYLRKNGVPYSEDAVVTEAFHRHDEPNSDVWITVTTIVDDPKYLNQPFITSSSFKKETDQSKWAPTPCATAVPLEKPVQGRQGGPPGV
jgi:hypothetical protein